MIWRVVWIIIVKSNGVWYNFLLWVMKIIFCLFVLRLISCIDYKEV